MIEQKLIADFKRPKNVEFKVDINDKYHGIFTAKPYERGFATTIGNSLRRTLLSSIPGYAVIAVKFDGINNEFQNIPGVYEDTAEIIVNLKAVAIKLKDKNIKSRVLHFDVKGKTEFTAKEFEKDETIEIGNPKHVIFTANKDASFSFDVQIDYGRGYVAAESFQDSIEIEGTIPIDANYSPVENVAFSIDKVRVGSRSDYEKLNLEIWTNGVLQAEDALREAAQILKESYLTFNNLELETPITSAVDDSRDTVTDEKDKVFYESVFGMSFTVRTHYFLKLNDIREVGQLVVRTEEELQEKKNYADSVLEDIKEKLAERNLTLNMKNINYVQKSMM